jgi:hypothetical protein
VTLVRTIVTYTYERRDIIGGDIKYLLVIERQMLRKIFGTIYCKEGWKKGSNKNCKC